MNKFALFIIAASLSLVACNKEESLHEPTNPIFVDPSSNDNSVASPEHDAHSNNQKSEDISNVRNNINAVVDMTKYEPEITGRLSKDPTEADSKKLTRCEYRYVDQNGLFISVVATISGNYVSVQANEQTSPDAEIKTYPKGSAVITAKYINDFLHKLDTYGNVKGPLTWADAPERENWKDDTSTTWIIANYEDIQYIISSRQQLPPERYRGFDTIFTYLTSPIPNFKREMRQNIGEPAPVETRLVHGKEVKLVPGKDGLLDYGDKKWWIEEEFVGHFELAPRNEMNELKEYGAVIPSAASIDINDDGTFILMIDGVNYKGSLENERKYNTMARASFSRTISNTTSAAKVVNGIERNNGSFFMDYDYNYRGVIEDESDIYKRIIINVEGEPYVHGRGALEPVGMILIRK